MKRFIPPRKYAGLFSGILLPLFFAAIVFLLNTSETFISSTEIKPGEVAPVTLRLPATYFRLTLLRNEVHFLTTTSSTCPNVIPKGEIVPKTSECAGLVQAFESYRRSQSHYHYAGLLVLYFAVALVLSIYFRNKTMGRARHLRAQLGLFTLMLIGLAVAKAVFLLTGFPALAAPVLFVPMLVGHYFRRRVAFAVAGVFSLIVTSFNNYDFSFFWVLSGAALAAVLFARPSRQTSAFLKAGVFAGWLAVLILVVTTLIQTGTIGVYDDPMEHFDPRYSLWIASIANGLLSALLAILLAPMMARFFGVVSRSRLVDLQDLNQRLLKRIREKAPGTWEHSRAMANLAEAAVNAIGGNTSLVRVGAYYHDVGKSNSPDYFIENQGNKGNPHDELDPESSATRIFKHVTDGTRLLRQEGVPEDVVEFCYSHHGTGVLEFFWFKTMSDGNPNDLTEKDFSYPGYKPTTRETGILMLVDAIEAGARTVDSPDKDTFSDLVRRIVFSKLSQGQLDESGLSLKDLKAVVNTLVDTLVNMYHARIKYPWQTGDTTGAVKLADGGDGGDSDKGTDETDTRGDISQKVVSASKSSTEEREAQALSTTNTSISESEEKRTAPKSKAKAKSALSMSLKVSPPPKDMEEPAWAMASSDEEESTGEHEIDDPKKTSVAMANFELPKSVDDDGPDVEILDVGDRDSLAPKKRPRRVTK